MEEDSLKKALLDSSDESVRKWLLRQPPRTMMILARECLCETNGLCTLKDGLRVKVAPLAEGHVGALGDTSRVSVWFADENDSEHSQTQDFIMKGVSEDRLDTSLRHGLTREVEIYSRILKAGNGTAEVEGVYTELIQSLAPEVVACESDPSSGAKRVLLKDLSKDMFESGAIIGGKHTPLNAFKDVEGILSQRYPDLDHPPPTQEEMVVKSFVMAARLHKAHWGESRLLKHSWLRNADLYRATFDGTTPKRHEETINFIREMWTKSVKPDMTPREDGSFLHASSGMTWTKRVVDLLEMAVSEERTSWSYKEATTMTRPYTLLHGDFHPGNLMISSSTGELKMLDFEMVAVGCGPQDCAQLVMSHLPPSCFGHAANIALEAYFQELTSGPDGVKNYTLDDCLQDYVNEGLGKWLTFLITLKSLLPPPMMSYFASQIDAFAMFHGIDADTWQGSLSF